MESSSQSSSSSSSYPSASRISDSNCYPQYSASLKCLEEFSTDKSKCQEHFDVYKECKKKENRGEATKKNLPLLTVRIRRQAVVSGISDSYYLPLEFLE
ncbi:hypothetical protein MKW92_019224 [Papaver armeniacum]|nr:hypothetical protein MKW92_019224 [Papaver armeniacum]